MHIIFVREQIKRVPSLSNSEKKMNLIRFFLDFQISAGIFFNKIHIKSFKCRIIYQKKVFQGQAEAMNFKNMKIHTNRRSAGVFETLLNAGLPDMGNFNFFK